MTDTHSPRAAQAADPVALALANLEGALTHDTATPAELVDELTNKLRCVEAALVPRRRSKAEQGAAAQLEAAREALRAKGLGALEEVRGAATAYRKAHGLPLPVPPRRRMGLAAALEDHPAPKSACRKLEWEIGRPPMLVGAPGAGKSFVVQAATLDLICGRALWGCQDFRVPNPQRVLHVDLDQGAAKTLRRYRRLLRGRGVVAQDEAGARRELAALVERDPRDLGTFDVDEGEGLVLGSLQPEELARWRMAWIDATRGYDVAFVDSLRRLAPFLDENDSRFSVVPDTMRAVSEAAQCVIVLLHHASNKSRDPKAKGTPGTRGSSAIDGAAGTQLVIEEDGEARKVTQTRAGEAAKLAPFYLTFDDDHVPGPSGIRGIRVAYQTAEQARAPQDEAKAARLRSLASKVLVYVQRFVAQKGHGVPGRRAIVEAVEGKDGAIYAAIQLLVDEGKLREVDDKSGAKKVQRILPATPAEGGAG